MKKVITYGTYDLLHYGHIRLLERARALGDYLIVGVTSDDFDKQRGKINVSQTLTERIEAVRALGIADEIIIEEYEGQKIDDIRRYGVDIFTVGSDWKGKFDYLKEYCQVVYLERTEGVSSTELRAEKELKFALAGSSSNIDKVNAEAAFVNGLTVTGITAGDGPEFDELLLKSDAVYIYATPAEHYPMVKKALEQGKHVLCETPVALSKDQCAELFALADEKKLVLMEALKTAFSTAYNRMILLLKGGKIGEIVSVDAVCTSMKESDTGDSWGSLADWGPTALLPVFELLGTKPVSKKIITRRLKDSQYDTFTRVELIYDRAVASVSVGNGVKSEGQLIISGTKGYVYVPAPWWKTDYFEIRYEDQRKNQRYFYQLDGEGIRYELAAFRQAVFGANAVKIGRPVTESIAAVMEDYMNDRNLVLLG